MVKFVVYVVKCIVQEVMYRWASFRFPACRQFDEVKEPDARLGLVALQLGQPEEAKHLFTAAGRPDLLNKMLQAS